MTISLSTIQQNTQEINQKTAQSDLGSSQLSSAGFMQVMLSQLQSQDPTNPVDDSQFVQQEASLSQIQTLNNLNTTMQQTSQLTQGLGLVNHKVDVKDSQGNVSTGIVTAASFGTDSNGNNTLGLSVNGQNYTMSQIQQVYGNSTN